MADSPPFKSVDRIHATIHAHDFFDRYVSNRKPAVIQGSLDDSDFKAHKWTDLGYLKTIAGDARVMVEPIAKASNQYGTGEQRVAMLFREFLETLESKEGPYPYLTTQYESEGGESNQELSAMFPPPTLALRNDFPVKPRLMGNLVLDQVNLWIGRSKDGSSSGLHHDFHDNLYCLLQGRKRFVLYPPSSSEHLYPNGKIDTVHSNGLISYQHLPVRADGLTPFDAAEHHLAIAKARLDAGLRRTAKPETVSKLKKEYKKARKVWIVAQGESTAVDEGERDSDDADVILRKLEAEEHRSGKGRKGASPNRSTRAGSKSNDEEWGGVLSPTTIDPAPTSTTPSDPSSFSRISTAQLHAHLNLSTTAINPSPVPGQYPDLIKAEKPYVVELQPGEMLYLPASWWHEVTSTGTTLASEAPHVAFNYWFHPPDLSNRLFDEPYSDQVLWSYLRKKVRKLTSKQKWKPEWRRKRERGEGEVNTSVKKRRINRNAASVAG